jgi:DNA polymerase
MLIAANTQPEDVMWLTASDQAGLPFPALALTAAYPRPARTERVPRAFIALAEVVACHRSTSRWAALYRLLWEVIHAGRHVLEEDTRDEVKAVKDMAAQVRRDEHKMHAFVRFAPVSDASGSRSVAWYEPDHLIVRRAAPFFAERFASMRWSILTPDLCAHWDGSAVSFTPGIEQPLLPADGDVTELWRAYYESVFNPARVNPRAMLRELPLKRWKNLPEAALIPHLLQSAHERTHDVNTRRAPLSARDFLPAGADLDSLRQAAASCRGCPLHAPATQVVFGEGPSTASIVLVGEQPGDAEDLAGRPFVGPAGQVLDAALERAGIARRRLYLTNAVKHFSFEPRGKRRIHQTPRISEMQACRPWLEAELQQVRPATVVALGSTAARALLGPQARVMTLRGRVLTGLAWAPRVIVTVHPSAVLRSQDGGPKYFAMLVEDLSKAVFTGDVAED